MDHEHVKVVRKSIIGMQNLPDAAPTVPAAPTAHSILGETRLGTNEKSFRRYLLCREKEPFDPISKLPQDRRAQTLAVMVGACGLASFLFLSQSTEDSGRER
ncbi:hypothetical protein LguiA_035892 [Lonicera macranthoides]